VTPYRYLQNIRINEAKKLLEQGILPIEVAMQTGFSDQSHFTNFFNKFIGLSPRVYRDIFIKNIDKGGIHNGKE
jgi:transcriptional regulator GlxA family with amidase domain